MGELENLLVDRITSLLWRLRRLGRVQAGIFAHEFYAELADRAEREACAQESTLSDLMAFADTTIGDEGKHREALQRAQEMRVKQDAENTALGRTFARDADSANAFAKLSRYETAIERGLYKALHELQRLQAARAAHLKDVLGDAREALSLAEGATATPATNEAAALLEKIVCDDVEEGSPPPKGPKRKGRPPNKKKEEPERPMSGQRDAPHEEDGPRLRRGVAKDRILSVVDPRMRLGHKSKRQTWAGYKVHIAEEPESELITQVEVRPANEYDAEAAPDLVGGQRKSVGLRPRELLCDGAYGSADVRARLREMGVEVVAKMRPLTDSKHFRKDEFEIDLWTNDGAGSVTCPAGVTTTDYRMARDGWYRPVKLFRFPREECDRCELRQRCLGGPAGRSEHPVRQPPGRQVQLHYHEEEMQKTRGAQRTPEQRKALREKLRPRAKVERKIAELVRPHGLRQGRYFGKEKTDQQAVLTATMVNAKRLFTLSVEDDDLADSLREALAA